ncbi:MAG: hypothetical protein BME93_02665 [Methanosarcinales archaeon Met12]|nr:MAG: hypothetical protein BME93_02665 [Methanosarcinales archaeon Met12]
MTGQLHQGIHINRREANSIEFDVQELIIPLNPGEETSFNIKVINYGMPTHVHLSATGDIRDKITFQSHNPYVRYEEDVPIIAKIPRGETEFYTGEIVVTTGYGSKKNGFITKLGKEPREDDVHLVNVDKRLGRRRMARIKRAGMLPELPPALPIALILAIFILLLTFVFKFIPETEIVGAMAFSILTVFVILYTITKLIKGIK